MNKTEIDTLIEGIKERSESVYPGLWDFQDELNTEGWYSLIIKFPEIEITNSSNLKHKITDLYCRIRFYMENEEDFKILTVLHCRRANITLLEYDSQYCFSHASCGNADWRGLCLGSDTIKMLLFELYDSFDLDKFEMFLNLLSVYFSWESLEGGPYIKISNLVYRNNMNSVSEADLILNYNIFIDKIPDFSFEIQDSKFLTNKDDVERKFSEFSTIKVKKTVNGSYHGAINKSEAERRAKNATSDLGHYKFLFKKEELACKVNYIEEPQNLENLVSHPSITDYIHRTLSKQMTDYYLLNQIEYAK